MINNAEEDESATEDDCQSNLHRAEYKPCPTCNGSGKVITGYGVICTELVEKIAECSDCRGKGFISAGGRRKGRLDLAPSRK